ncbi:MAG: hypothetical protein MHMPM18_001434 [Marteilia pararefringens]
MLNIKENDQLSNSIAMAEEELKIGTYAGHFLLTNAPDIIPQRKFTFIPLLLGMNILALCLIVLNITFILLIACTPRKKLGVNRRKMQKNVHIFSGEVINDEEDGDDN